MFEHNGVVYDVGTVIAFEIGRRCLIGIITEIYPDGNNISCVIAEPSGHKRIRTLDYDVKNGSIVQVADDEAFYMNTDQWKKRFIKRYQGQG